MQQHSCYPPQDDDDLYVIEYARSKDMPNTPSFVVSNDMYRDHMQSYSSDSSFAPWVKAHIISYSFVADDDFMPNPQAMKRLRKAVQRGSESSGSSGSGSSSQQYQQQYPAAGQGSGADQQYQQHYPAAGQGSGAGACAGPSVPDPHMSTVHMPHSDVDDSDDEGARAVPASDGRHVLGSLEMPAAANRQAPADHNEAVHSGMLSSFESAHAAMVRGMAVLTASPWYAQQVGPAVMQHRIPLPAGGFLGGAAPLHTLIMSHMPSLLPALTGGLGAGQVVAGPSTSALAASAAAGSGPAVPMVSSSGPSYPPLDGVAAFASAEQVCERVMGGLPAALREGSRARATAALVRDGVAALGSTLFEQAGAALAGAGMRAVAGNSTAASVFAAAAVEAAVTDWLRDLAQDAAERSKVYSHVIMLKVEGESAGNVAHLTPAVLAATMTQVASGAWQQWLFGGTAGAARLKSAHEAGVSVVKAIL